MKNLALANTLYHGPANLASPTWIVSRFGGWVGILDAACRTLYTTRGGLSGGSSPETA